MKNPETASSSFFNTLTPCWNFAACRLQFELLPLPYLSPPPPLSLLSLSSFPIIG